MLIQLQAFGGRLKSDIFEAGSSIDRFYLTFLPMSEPIVFNNINLYDSNVVARKVTFERTSRYGTIGNDPYAIFELVQGE